MTKPIPQVPSSLHFLADSESVGLVSLPRCKHTEGQKNNEAAGLEETCFPAERHHMSLLMHLDSLFLRLAARNTRQEDDHEIASHRVLHFVFTDARQPIKASSERHECASELKCHLSRCALIRSYCVRPHGQKTDMTSALENLPHGLTQLIPELAR